MLYCCTLVSPWVLQLPTLTTNSSSIYLSDCTSEEVFNVISELQNGKSSDVPIHVVKASSQIISPVLSMLYNKCMNEGNFPIELKTGKISPNYRMGNQVMFPYMWSKHLPR